MDLSSDDVQDILKLLDDLPFGEMHLQTSRFSLVLRRAPDGEWTQETQVVAGPAALPEPPPPESAVPAAPEPADDAGPAREAEGLVAVRTPLPGTFYRAPRPGAPPFVDTGSRVEPDTVVAIVETMKLMNSVSAGVSGTVAQILLGNAEPAGRDAALMLIRVAP